MPSIFTLPLQTGNSGNFLTTNGTSPSWSSVSATSAFNITSQNTTYSAVINDYILCSGASFTITLPTAVGQSGKQIIIQHSGTSLTQVYTLNTTSAQTIGGIASGSYALYTNQETLQLVSDNANWQVVNHKTETALVNSGTLVVTAITPGSGITFGTTTVNKVWWKRDGQFAWVLYDFAQTSAGNNHSASGAYLFQLPTNLSMDSSIVTFNTVVATVGANTTTFGSFNGNSGGSAAQFEGVFAVPYDSTHFRLCGLVGGSAAIVGVGSAWDFASTAPAFGGWIKVPISNWQP